MNRIRVGNRKILYLSGVILFFCFSAIAVFAVANKFDTELKRSKDISYGIPLSEVADKIEQVYLYTNSFDNVSDKEFGNLGTLVNEEAVRASVYLLEGNKVLFLPENKENTQASLNGKTYGMHYSAERDGYLFYILNDWRLAESGVPVNSIESSCIQYCTVKEHDEGAAASGTEHDRPKPFVPDYDGEYAIDDLAYLGEIELSFPEDKLVKVPLVDLGNNEYIDEVISCISDTLREKEKYGSYDVRVGEYRRIFDKYGETTMGYVTTVITGNGLKEYASFEVIDNGNGYDAFPVNGLSLENSPFLFMRNKYDEDIVRKVEKVSENVIHLEVEEDSVSMPEKRSPIYDEKCFDFKSMDLDEITDIVENVCCYCDWFGMYELGYQEGKLRELNQEELIVYSWHNTGKTLFFIPEKMVNMAVTGKDGQEYPLYVNDKGEIELYMLEWNPYAEKKGQLGTTYVSHHTFGSREHNFVEYLIKLGNIHIDLNKAPSVDPVEADDEYVLALEEHIKELFEQNQKEGGFEIYLGEYEAIKDEITSDRYLENGKEEDIDIYYGDETVFVPNSDEAFFDDGYYKVDFLNIGRPIYIQKSNHIPSNTYSMWFLKCNFKMQNLENNTMVELDNMKIGEYIPSDFDPILVQMWFKESERKVYTFCLYYVCDYNYVLNVLLMEGDKVSRVRTDLISPKREFVLTEGEIFHDM